MSDIESIYMLVLGSVVITLFSLGYTARVLKEMNQLNGKVKSSKEELEQLEKRVPILKCRV